MYKVALLFAGKQRNYVEKVAQFHQTKGISVFYDDFERIRLWGTLATEVFHLRFENDSEYVVMFISKNSVNKAWPTHERRSAISRMVGERKDSVLPVSFDYTQLEGLPIDVLYEKASCNTPAELATKIAEKL